MSKARVQVIPPNPRMKISMIITVANTKPAFSNDTA